MAIATTPSLALLSPLGRCAHQSFPFAERPAKTQLAGGLPAEARSGIASFAALGVRHVLVMAARDENVRRQRIVFPPHLLALAFRLGSGLCPDGGRSGRFFFLNRMSRSQAGYCI